MQHLDLPAPYRSEAFADDLVATPPRAAPARGAVLPRLLALMTALPLATVLLVALGA